MICVFPFHKKDASELERLLGWILDLQGCPDHEALLVADATVDWPTCSNLLTLANKAFRRAKCISTENHVEGWIPGANALFRTASKRAQELSESFFWCEPDAVPLKPRWLTVLDATYRQCGKPFMGALIKPEDPKYPEVIMEGVACYPPDTFDRLTSLWDDEKVWLVQCAPLIVPHAVNTLFIQQLWGNHHIQPMFVEVKTPSSAPQDFALNDLRPQAVIFHRQKDGSLIRLLRRRMFPDQVTDKAEAVKGPAVFLQMGRSGDLILLLPAFKAWAEKTGFKTIVVTSREYGDVLDGCSYVQAVKLNYDWYYDIKKAIQWASTEFGGVTVTQLHGGNGWTCPPDNDKSFSLSMWARTGMRDDYWKLPLVFDQRHLERERVFAEMHLSKTKPTLLVNFSGTTSPFDHGQKIIDLAKQYDWQVLDIGNRTCKAQRIYDVLGLMDRARGLVTIDTATLHLAAASKVPVINLVRGDGQSGSIPKNNNVLTLTYQEAESHMKLINSIFKIWASGGKCPQFQI